MRHHLASLLASFLLLLWAFAFCAASDARDLVIYHSHDYISHNYEIQHFIDTINLEAGQLEVPLSMTICNGSLDVPSFKWFRIMVNGEIIATEQDLHGKEEGLKDISGLLRGSDLQVQIEAAGVPGANLWWTLSTQQMELTQVEPSQAMPGQQVKLLGGNIPASANLLSVTFNGKPARVISASVGSVVVEVPSDASLGQNEIVLRTGKQTSNAVTMPVVSKPVPDILGIDVWMAPPGGTINISGRNFSSDASQNKVYFGKIPAQISACSSNALSVIVPTWSWGPRQLNIPITVEVNGARSNSYPFDIGPMYHGATPSFGHD